MSQTLTLFNVIPAGAQRTEILQRLIIQQKSVLLKDENEESVEFTACGVTPDGNLQCHVPEGLPFRPDSSGLYSTSFVLGSEKYLLEVRPVVSENLVTLRIDTFFHLQRRKNYRYKVPQETEAKFLIQALNNKKVDHLCSLTDISSEGFSAVIGMEEVSLNSFDKVSGVIVCDNLAAISVCGQIKNLRLFGECELTVGVEFDHLSSANENALIDMISYLQRQAFQKKVA